MKALQTHIARQHRYPVIFKCASCPRFFPTKDRLFSHVNHHHESRICDVCQKSFKNSNTLRSHKFRRHSSTSSKVKKLKLSRSRQSSVGVQVRFNCLECDSSFGTKGGLWKHSQKHDDTKKITENQNENVHPGDLAAENSSEVDHSIATHDNILFEDLIDDLVLEDCENLTEIIIVDSTLK